MVRKSTLFDITKELAEWRKSRPLSPCIDQTKKDIEKYYRAAPIGALAAIRRTHGGVLQYTLAEITDRITKTGKIDVKNFGCFYMKSGSYCLYPTGQTNLVVPTDEVKAWVAEHPRGKFGVSIYRGRVGRE